MNALVVNSDVRTLELLEFQLTKLDFIVQAAHSFIAASSIARRVQPELIIVGANLAPGEYARQCKLLQSAAGDPIMVAIGGKEALDLNPDLRLSVDLVLSGDLKAGPIVKDIRRLVWLRKGVLCPAQPGLIEHGALLISPGEGTIHVEGRQVPISPREADLMYCLARRSPNAVARETLLNLIWGSNSHGDSDRRVEACIYTIRRKIEPDPANPTYLVLRRGLGYVLNS